MAAPALWPHGWPPPKATAAPPPLCPRRHLALPHSHTTTTVRLHAPPAFPPGCCDAAARALAAPLHCAREDSGPACDIPGSRSPGPRCRRRAPCRHQHCCVNSSTPSAMDEYVVMHLDMTNKHRNQAQAVVGGGGRRRDDLSSLRTTTPPHRRLPCLFLPCFFPRRRNHLASYLSSPTLSGVTHCHVLPRLLPSRALHMLHFAATFTACVAGCGGVVYISPASGG